MRDEGVIKFDCRWQSGDAPALENIGSLLATRQRLFCDGLIGVYPDGIGFGNISIRKEPGGSQFIISASQTGHIKDAHPSHFVQVTQYNLAENWIDCVGPAKASSESLTHAMVYETFPEANAVIHVHNKQAWEKLQAILPTSAPNVPYGTPAMADEVKRLAAQTTLAETKVFVMAGHEDGILSFGKDLEEAYACLRKYV